MTTRKSENLLQKRARWWWTAALFWGTLLLILLLTQMNHQALFRAITNFSLTIGSQYERWFGQQVTANPAVLLPLAFAGGLLSSISPCILSLLPINLSYIGTREIKSRGDAFVKASLFVLGVVTVLSLFGLFSALMVTVLVKFRGYFHILVGAFIVLMGLSLWGIVRLPLPRTHPKVAIAGPYSVGLMFALVSSPCASPVMFAVLASGAATGSQVLSMLAMVCYALGYTAIIFFASLFAGLAKQTRLLLENSTMIIRTGSIVLLLVGAYYLVDGVRWVLAVMARTG
ncbi:MAG: cytochrome c biogenesis protein CcdA [Scytolyngbya sp. HA4215-MV1]|nr:cytochrome c biogenesis protein CcdA [Scytolyngbya sp. HA4215-MV1]